MIEIELDAEDWACAGLRLVNDERRPSPDENNLAKTLAAPAERKPRIRRPTLEKQLKAVWKAARAAGVSVAVIVGHDTVTVAPAPGRANVSSSDAPDIVPAVGGDINEWDRDLGTNSPSLRQ